MSGGYALTSAKQRRSISPARKIRKEQMKLTIRQKLRNWIMSDDYETDFSGNAICVDERHLSSDGMKFELFKANGGYIVETRYYDSKSDRHHNKLHIINDENDIGEALGKIITMESLR
jgi:hypothetical protein